MSYSCVVGSSSRNDEQPTKQEQDIDAFVCDKYGEFGTGSVNMHVGVIITFNTI